MILVYERRKLAGKAASTSGTPPLPLRLAQPHKQRPARLLVLHSFEDPGRDGLSVPFGLDEILVEGPFDGVGCDRDVDCDAAAAVLAAVTGGGDGTADGFDWEAGDALIWVPDDLILAERVVFVVPRIYCVRVSG